MPAVADDDSLTARIWADLAPGFRTRDEVVQAWTEATGDDPGWGVSPAEVPGLVDGLWRLRRQQLATGGPGDDLKVAVAFRSLEAAGIVTRMYCGFDQGEGSRISREAASARAARGFVFFHAQDAARLAFPDAVLYLGFDAVGRFADADAYHAAATRVGRDIEAELAAAGVTVVWDGTPASRIAIAGPQWRRPLPEVPAPTGYRDPA